MSDIKQRLLTDETGKLIVEAIQNTDVVKKNKAELDEYFATLKENLPDTYDEQNGKIDNIKNETNSLKETIESFGLFVDESGYLCQQLESEE